MFRLFFRTGWVIALTLGGGVLSNAQSNDVSVFQTAAAAATSVPPYAMFQYSALTGSGNTITATEVPVVTSTGATIFKNLTLQFSVDSAGNLTVSTGYPQVIPAPPPIVSSFKSGRYTGPSSDTSFFITVGGPGSAPGGATEWTLSTPTDAAYCTYPGTATWYVGPLSSNPIAARLKQAGITSTAWSYGIGGSGCVNGYNWRANTLIGVSQVGNTITFVSFTYDGTDYALPRDQITYTLVQ